MLEGGANPFVLEEEPNLNPRDTLARPIVKEREPLAAAPAGPLTPFVEPVDMAARITAYQTAIIRDGWKAYKIDGSPAGTIQIIGQGSAPIGSINDMSSIGPAYYRRCVILPNTVKSIIVYPPVNGDVNKMVRCLADLEGRATIPIAPAIGAPAALNDTFYSNTVVLFSAPFYGQVAANNIEVFKRFIAFTQKPTAGAAPPETQATYHILTDYTRFNTAVGLQFRAAAPPLGAAGTPLLNMIEPTYVIYPYKQQYRDMERNDTIPISGLLFSAAAKDEVVLPERKPALKTVMSPIKYIASGKRGSIAYPVNLDTRDADFQRANPSYVNQRTIALDPNAAALVSERPLAVNDYVPTDTLYVTVFQVVGVVGAAGAAEGRVTRERRFIKEETFSGLPLEELYTSGVQTKAVSLGANTYSLRHPKTPGVIDDWKDLKFTEDEARFINDLNIRPNRLSAMAWGNATTWPDVLAENMTTIVFSDCFKDSRLVLHSACKTSRTFISRIMKDLLENQSEKIAQEQMQEKAATALAKLPVPPSPQAGAPAAPAGAPRDPFQPILNNQYGLAEDDIAIYNTTKSKFDFKMYFYNEERNDAGDVTQPNEYGRYVLVINKATGEERLGYIKCLKTVCSTFQDAADTTERNIKKLRKDFPEYIFIP